ncbi:MAG: hypothetical protein QXI19_06960 [Candidatus Caldarchaeum sp.]
MLALALRMVAGLMILVGVLAAPKPWVWVGLLGVGLAVLSQIPGRRTR